MNPLGNQYSRRIQKLENLIQSLDLEAFIVTDLFNIRYLCGFSGTDGILVVSRGGVGFLTDSRYTEQARAQVVADHKIEYRIKNEGLINFLREQGLSRVGFEAETVPFATVRKWRNDSQKIARWIPVGEELLSLRGVKAPSELEALEEATRISAKAFDSVLPLLKPGIQEQEFSLELEIAIRRLGAEEKAFDFIVASGSRGALPHGVASERRIQAGELVTVDFGARFAGYHSDETITVAVGSVSPKHQEIFEVVYQAQQRAMDLIRPGIPLQEIDKAAREYIHAAGYGEFFGHGLGHGVGLEVHEFPTLNPRSKDVAEEGMVFTVEPGVYVPGFGGVRIEDMVVVTENGYRKVTRLPKELRTLPC